MCSGAIQLYNICISNFTLAYFIAQIWIYSLQFLQNLAHNVKTLHTSQSDIALGDELLTSMPKWNCNQNLTLLSKNETIATKPYTQALFELLSHITSSTLMGFIWNTAVFVFLFLLSFSQTHSSVKLKSRISAVITQEILLKTNILTEIKTNRITNHQI